MNPAQLQRHVELDPTHWWLLETKRLAADAMRRHLPAGGRVLDAGGGVGGLRRLLQPDYEVIMLDVWDAALALARRGGGRALVQATVEALPFPPESFDAIVSLDVLYHENVGDDGQAMREARRVLHPGGIVVLNLPAYEWMRSAHDAVAGGARRYTRQRTRALLTENGFTPVRVGYRNALLFPVAVLKRKAWHRSGSDLGAIPLVLNRVLIGVLRAEALWLRHWTFPFGLSVFAVGRRI